MIYWALTPKSCCALDYILKSESFEAPLFLCMKLWCILCRYGAYQFLRSEVLCTVQGITAVGGMPSLLIWPSGPSNAVQIGEPLLLGFHFEILQVLQPAIA